MADTVPIARLRRKILSDKGVVLKKHTKQLLTVDEQPDIFPKTPTMKMLEYKYHIKIELIIFKGSLSDVVQLLHGDIDASTISKWRKYVQSHIGKVYYE